MATDQHVWQLIFNDPKRSRDARPDRPIVVWFVYATTMLDALVTARETWRELNGSELNEPNVEIQLVSELPDDVEPLASGCYRIV